MRSLIFYIAFFGLLIADLLLLHMHPEGNWRLFFEPLMMLLLLFYFRHEYRLYAEGYPRLILIALIALIFGGFFLMEANPMNNFLVAFCFFLISNIAYTLMFYRYSDLSFKRVIPFITVASLLAMVLLYYFYDALGDYFLPASFYIFVLLNCIQAAFLQYGMINPRSFTLMFSGVILFFFAQVIAAIHYFLVPEDYLVFLIVATFFTSQLLIVKGVNNNLQFPYYHPEEESKHNALKEV